jgi:hypothetical protein
MVTEDIINELDKFITKYKTLKTDNQNLNQFKTDVKTALNSKGIINTSEDAEVINSVNTYIPPKSGGSLDVEYLKKVGLLPDNFVGTPTEKDLIVNKFIVPSPYNDRIFITSEFITSIKIELDGRPYSNYDKNPVFSLHSSSYLDPNKVKPSYKGYYVNEFKFKDKGTYKVTMNVGNLVMEKTFDYDPNIVKSMGDYLIYAVNINEGKILCHDEDGVLMSEYIDKSRLGENIKNNTLKPLDSKLAAGGWVSTGTKIGYVLNLRTGIAHKVNFTRDSQANSAITRENKKKYLAPIIYSGRLDIVTEPSIYSLLVSGKNSQTFIKDIDYGDGDTLVLAFHRDSLENLAHSYPEEAVAEYLKKIFKGMPNHIALENGE